MDSSLSRKHLMAGPNTTKAAIGRGAPGVGVLHSTTNRRQKKQNYSNLNSLRDLRSEFATTPKEVPLVQSLSGLYKAQH